MSVAAIEVQIGPAENLVLLVPKREDGGAQGRQVYFAILRAETLAIIAGRECQQTVSPQPLVP